MPKYKKQYFLSGPLLGLRPVERSDLALIAGWVNDPVTTYFMFTGQRPQSLEQVEKNVLNVMFSSENAVFMMCDKKSGRPIGYAGLYDLHATARRAEFRILIGEKTARGRGYGTEAAELMLFYGFDRLNLQRIWLGVTAENKGGIRAYEKAGFVKEGVLRDDIYRNSRYYDTVRYAVLRDAYYKKLYFQHREKFKII